ncbi:MAG: PEP-CTERM sorting domain-containing protein [Scytonematopsis contorta HA4267-MV1]|nr:PEP-CTERM sorting domain-containing protein [Scytonematopsis contorta HA4267-MV1]
MSTLTLLGVLTSRPAAAAMFYSITDIGSRLDFRDTINNSSQVVKLGKTINTKGQKVDGQFLINSDGTKKDLGVITDYYYEDMSTNALAVNNLGQVVGNSGFDAFVWTEEKGITRIASSYSIANDINDKGQIVLYEGSPGSGFISYIYNLGTGKKESIPIINKIYTSALGINEKGDVVGGAYDGTVSAYVYTNGVLQYLNDLISPQSGWTLEFGIDINDAGQIIGNGIFNGEERAFLLTPYDGVPKAVPEPSSYVGVFLAAFGALGVQQRRRKT